MNCLCLLLLPVVWSVCSSLPEKIMVGYLTGSQRKPGDNVYPRLGQTISGAISYAIHQINQNYPLIQNNSLDFVVAETFGQESESIRQTAKLWMDGKVSAYIGPQETCVHEARMAASFNLPMISYVSDKEHSQICRIISKI